MGQMTKHQHEAEQAGDLLIDSACARSHLKMTRRRQDNIRVAYSTSLFREVYRIFGVLNEINQFLFWKNMLWEKIEVQYPHNL